MPKKTIYINDADQEIWDQAEALAVKESFSGLLTDALRSYIQGRRAIRATVRLVGSQQEIVVRVEPMGGGWLINVPHHPLTGQTSPLTVVEELEHSEIVVPRSIKFDWRTDDEELWVWVPATKVISLRFLIPRYVGGVDYQDVARMAWPILVDMAKGEKITTYGELAEKLGGLNPYTQVPKVLDIIQRWCLSQKHPDLTSVVVSKEMGIPGSGYWKAHKGESLSVPEQMKLWEGDRKQSASFNWPTGAPF